MTMQSLESPSSGWRCQQCGLPGVRVSDDSSTHAYFKCVPCNRSLGLCPCTTPGARTTSTCPCGESVGRSGSESPGLEDEVPRGVSMFSTQRKNSLNPHNPDEGFDEDWEANCSPGFMVKRFKASGREFLPH
ncbi:uncharacterized protein N7496_005894 [Penicillium cataractarum]|uniref:Uncharacterized protein n=1 Tax=Penicillium cataractarum TaxID=2100454 RepID=A0A9W9S0H4_9EURO|nr:uncharacterized protein N7496_005894 [Penicillium cataractarum]KAJ5369802.1 hypothetical protein N7496_005894 [Penicillium cataractarum]